MNRLRLVASSMLFGACLGVAFAQVGARSDGAAIASLLSRRSAAEGKAIVSALVTLQGRGKADRFGPNTGFDATKSLILSVADPAVEGAWADMIDFDRQALTILARETFFGGLDETTNGGVERPLAPFVANPDGWARNIVVKSPDLAARDWIAGRMGSLGSVFVAALAAIENDGAKGNRNLGQVNAEQVLLDAVASGSRGDFQRMWTNLEFGDREGALILVRDALLGGLNDL